MKESRKCKGWEMGKKHASWIEGPVISGWLWKIPKCTASVSTVKVRVRGHPHPLSSSPCMPSPAVLCVCVIPYWITNSSLCRQVRTFLHSEATLEDPSRLQRPVWGLKLLFKVEVRIGFRFGLALAGMDIWSCPDVEKFFLVPTKNVREQLWQQRWQKKNASRSYSILLYVNYY